MASSLVLWFKKHGYMVAVIVAVTVVFIWFVTYGTWQLFEPDDGRCSFADRFFAAQAMSLLDGRVDVPQETIEYEGYRYNGKHHGYFGIATSLMRIPFILLFPGTETRWNRPLFALGCVVNLVCAYLLLRTTRTFFVKDTEPGGFEKCVYAAFILVAGLGSTIIYLGSRSFLYHEPIIWGSAFALLFYYTLLRYLIRPRLRTLIVACAWSLCAFLTRAPQGAGTVVCLVLFAITTGLLAFDPMDPAHRRRELFRLVDFYAAPVVRRRWAPVAIALASIVLTVSCYLAINYAKFGTMDGMPLHLNARYQVFNQSAEFNRIEGKPFHLSNIRMLFVNYFSPNKIIFNQYFPWVYVTSNATSFPEAKIDFCSEFSSVTASKPALLFVAAFGVYAACVTGSSRSRRKIRLPLLGAAAVGAVELVYTVISERYTHDFYPFLIIAGALGVTRILSFRSLGLRLTTWLIFFPLAAYSIYVNCAFALVHQREILVNAGFTNMWTEEKGAEFQRWRNQIDSYFLKQGE